MVGEAFCPCIGAHPGTEYCVEVDDIILIFKIINFSYHSCDSKSIGLVGEVYAAP